MATWRYCALSGPCERAQDRSQRGAPPDRRIEERPRVRHHRLRGDLPQVDLGLRELDLAVLVDEAVRVLAESDGFRDRLGRLVDDSPLVVEVDVGAVHPRVDDVVHVLAAQDPRVERDVREHLAVQGEDPAEGDVRALDARRLADHRERLVERIALAPEHVAPVRLVVALPAALRVGVEAALGQQRRAVVELRAEPVHGAFEEVRRRDDLVVVDEDDRVVAENRSGHEADVAHRPVALEGDAVDHVGELELFEAPMQAAELGRAEDERLDVGEVGDDVAHLVLGAVLDRLVGRGHDDDDLAEALDLLAASASSRAGCRRSRSA